MQQALFPTFPLLSTIIAAFPSRIALKIPINYQLQIAVIIWFYNLLSWKQIIVNHLNFLHWLSFMDTTNLLFKSPSFSVNFYLHFTAITPWFHLKKRNHRLSLGWRIQEALKHFFSLSYSHQYFEDYYFYSPSLPIIESKEWHQVIPMLGLHNSYSHPSIKFYKEPIQKWLFS